MGKTSWTAKPEKDDYASVLGFIIYYIHCLDPFKDRHPTAEEHTTSPTAKHSTAEEQQTASPTRSPNSKNGETKKRNVASKRAAPVLIIGGYSYGAVVTTQLPPLPTILERFASPPSHSDAAHIRLRAETLAEQQNTLISTARQAFLELHRPCSPSRRGLRVGGDEGGSPRPSTDSFGRRSLSRDVEDKFHDILAKTRSSLHKHRHHNSHGNEPHLVKEGAGGSPAEPAKGMLPAISNLLAPRVAYLLVSPLPGMATHLVTLSLLPTALSRSKNPASDPAEAKLIQHPTLAVYGEEDGFVTTHKARGWVSKLGSLSGSLFKGVEVASAGHFWAEGGVLQEMVGVVGDFAGGLLEGNAGSE